MKELLVLGASGLVGSKFIGLYGKDFAINAPDISELDILDKNALIREFERINPDVVINFAAYTDVAGAQNQSGDRDGSCYQINAVGAQNIASVCRRFNKKLIHISTEYVFDGTKSESPYTEDDKPKPINWYGETKYFAENFVAESGCESVIMRICMPFSAHYELKKDVARFFLGQLKAGNPISAIEDQKITPTLVDDIASALKVIVDSDATGLYHVSSTSYTTPLAFAKLIAQTFDLNSSLVKPVSFEEYNKRKEAKMLKYSWLNPAKFEERFGNNILHSVEEAVRLFKAERIYGK